VKPICFIAESEKNSQFSGEGKKLPRDGPWTILARAKESNYEISSKVQSHQVASTRSESLLVVRHE
jgi:hypothetical protein